MKRLDGRFKWSKEEIEILNKNYHQSNKDFIIKNIPNKSWESICLYANKNGLHRNLSLRKRRNDCNKLYKLLEETPEAYYWIGFIMADGCMEHIQRLDKIYFRLSLSSAIKDKKHLKRFCNLINSKIEVYNKNYKNFNNKGIKNYPYVKTRIGQSKIISELMYKFNFNKNKTYNPPKKLKFTNNKLFTSFIIGYIDGDGSIHKNTGSIKIQCHSSWNNVLNKWFIMLWKISKCKIKNKTIKIPRAIVRKDGYCYVETRNQDLTNYLKNKSEELNLPCLKRKWDRIF